MPETVTCPDCQRKLLLPEDYAGQQVQCPGCQASFLAGSQLPIGTALPAAQPRNILATPADPGAVAGNYVQEAPRLRLPTSRAGYPVLDPLVLRKPRRPRGKAGWLLVLAAGVAALVVVGISFIRWTNAPRAMPAQNLKRIVVQEDGERRRRQVKEAFRNQKPLTVPQIRQELQPLFEDLGAALRARDQNRVLVHLDAERLADELLTLELFPELVRRHRAPLVQGLRQGLGQSLIQNAHLLAWSSFEIKHIHKLEGNEAVVIACHHVDANRVKLLRWWVSKQQGSWQVFDLEDLNWGVRLAMDAAAAAGKALGDPGGLAQGITDLRDAQVAAQTDVDAAARKLERCAGVQFPRHLQALRWLTTALIRLNRHQDQEALEALERGHECWPDMPCLDLFQGIAFNELNKWDRALKHLETYRDLAGEDGVVCLHLGKALHGVQRYPEACASYRKALDYDPQASDAFFNLLRAAPPAEPLPDLEQRFARLGNRRQNFDSCAEDCWKFRNLRQVEALARIMQKLDPHYAPAAYYLALIQGEAGQAAPAVRQFQNALAWQDDAVLRKNYVAGFMQAMAKAGRFTEAYAAGPEPREAFHFLAAELAKAYRMGDLRLLVDLHRKKHADDPLLPFYQGELYIQEGDYGRADQAFRAGLARPPDQPTLDQFRASRVQACYYTGQALAALAEIWPRHATFRDLCQLCLQDQDETQLAAVLAAHAKTDPSNPDLLWFRCRLKIMQNRLPEALTLFKAVLAKTASAERRKDIVYQFLLAMVDAGKPLEGYRAVPDARQAFPIVAGGLRNQDRWDELRRLVDAHGAAHADDAWLLYYQGQVFARDQAWERAAQVLRAAWQKAPADARNDFRWAHLYAQYKAGHALQAYREIEPRNDTFHQLIDLLAADKKGAEMDQLIAAHRAEVGNDPDLVFYHVRAMIFRGQAGVTGPVLQQACMQQAQEQQRRYYISTYVWDMARAGQGLAAYRNAPDQREAFATLAGYLVAQKQTRELGELLEAHGKKHAGDALYPFYTAELHLLRGEARQAKEVFAAALARVKPPNQWSYRFGLLRASVKAGQAAAAYQELGRGSQTFESLAGLCLGDRDARQLTALLAAHHQVEPDDPSLLLWEMQLKCLQKDYAGALKVYEAHRTDVFTPRRFKWRGDDLLVRCLVKLERTEEAVREVDTPAGKRLTAPMLRILAHAAHGGVQEALAEMAKLRAQPFLVAACYQDPDLGPMLRGEPFGPFRARYPEPKGPAPDAGVPFDDD